jgi:hypothetical protein
MTTVLRHGLGRDLHYRVAAGLTQDQLARRAGGVRVSMYRAEFTHFNAPARCPGSQASPDRPT